MGACLIPNNTQHSQSKKKSQGSLPTIGKNTPEHTYSLPQSKA